MGCRAAGREKVTRQCPESFRNCANGTDLPLTVLYRGGSMAAIDGKIFATRQGAGRTENERSGGSVGGCRRPVPHSADGGLIPRNYRSNGSAGDGRGPQGLLLAANGAAKAALGIPE